MTTIWIRTALLGISALALQACTLTMDQAQYPPDRQQAAAPPPAAQPAPPPPVDPHDPVARPSTGVQQQALPPAANAGPVSENDSPVMLFTTTEPVALRTIAAAYHHRRARTRSHEADSVAAQHVKVKKGETLKSIAARYGTTAQALMKANHIRHPKDLEPGQELIIPASKHTPTLRERREEAAESGDTASAKTPKVYHVKKGDTIYSIGRQFHLSPKAIMQANDYNGHTRLHVGDAVKLPRSPEEEQAAQAEARRIAAARERPHQTIQSPSQAMVGPAQDNTQAMNATHVPDHPVPYNSLPNHLTATNTQPPTRALLPPPVIPQEPPQGPPDAQVLLAGKGRFIWPVKGQVVSTFGPKAGGQRSDGLEIAAPVGTPVHAAAAGDVVYAGILPDLGDLVLIKHDDGWITAYAHLSRTEVKIRDHVAQGQEVGQAGQTGTAAQPEVYFEIRYAPTPRDKARPVDPGLLLAAQ